MPKWGLEHAGDVPLVLVFSCALSEKEGGMA